MDQSKSLEQRIAAIEEWIRNAPPVGALATYADRISKLETVLRPPARPCDKAEAADILEALSSVATSEVVVEAMMPFDPRDGAVALVIPPARLHQMAQFFNMDVDAKTMFVALLKWTATELRRG